MTASDIERRYFRRYGSATAFPLKLRSGTYQCRIIDYSADGICFLFEDPPPLLKTGEIIHIQIDDPHLDLSGEVVWTKVDDAGMAAGFRRIGAIRGSCTDFRLPDILLGLQRSMKTGTLEIMRGTRLIKIFFKDGDMIFASTNQEDDRFGEVLLKRGRITLKQYFEGSEELKRTGKRLGNVLLDLGYLQPSELVDAVRHQVEEIIVSFLTAECGFFVFKEGPLPSNETITLNLSAANLIYRSIKRVTNFQYILEDFPHPDAVLVLSENPLDLFQDIAMDEDDKEIFSRVSGETPIGEILSRDPGRNFETVKTIYALLSARIISVRVEGAPIPAVTPEGVVQAAQSDIDPDYVKMVDDVHRSLAGAGYYGILGLTGRATAEEITESYYRLAKEFHPDRHFSLPSEELKQKLNLIFARINEAHDTLANKAKRAEYDKSLAAGKGQTQEGKPEQKKDSAEKSFEEGKMQLSCGAEAAAVKLFAEAVYWDNSNPIYHYYLGLALNRRRSYKEAARTLENAIRIDPDVAHFHAELGSAFQGLGYLKRAQTQYRQALTISPDNRRALAGLREVDEALR